MVISLYKAGLNDCHQLYQMQVQSFKALLDHYQDYDFNPGSETIEKTKRRLEETNSDYYIIQHNDMAVGAVRVVYSDPLCKLKQIFVLPEYQGKGYAQQAIKEVEGLYPYAIRWELETIKQEDKLCYLYEKLGYQKTGAQERLKEGMDLVYYAKQLHRE